MIGPENVAAMMDRLKAISDSWLEEKNTREKGFSLGFFRPAYVSRFPVGLVRHQGEVKAFVNVWASAEQEELSVDLMRHSSNAPGGIMDYLFIELMLWGKAQGYRWFNLGMAPLSGMETGDMAPMWHRVGSLVARVGDHFYNFQGVACLQGKIRSDMAAKIPGCAGRIEPAPHHSGHQRSDLRWHQGHFVQMMLPTAHCGVSHGTSAASRRLYKWWTASVCNGQIPLWFCLRYEKISIAGEKAQAFSPAVFY